MSRPGGGALAPLFELPFQLPAWATDRACTLSITCSALSTCIGRPPPFVLLVGGVVPCLERIHTGLPNGSLCFSRYSMRLNSWSESETISSVSVTRQTLHGIFQPEVYTKISFSSLTGGISSTYGVLLSIPLGTPISCSLFSKSPTSSNLLVRGNLGWWNGKSGMIKPSATAVGA